MICEKINIAGSTFLKIELIPFIQKQKHFYIGKIPAKHFLKLYTVEPAEYDIKKQAAFAAEFKDDDEYYMYLVDEDKKRIDSKAFQRKENQKRIKEISNFLNNEDFALFPNSIIATCDLINDYLGISDDSPFDETIVKNADKNNTLSYLEKNGANNFLFIPYKSESLLVIDGQHRIKGIENCKQETIDNYELLVSFIIEYDRSAIAKLFYTINYTQKSVNKSLLYHLTGEFSHELNEITFMHELVKILNELENSPFKGRIKMLGDVPKELAPDEKKIMSISQAFLIDYLKGSISEKALRSIHQPIFLYYFKNQELQIEIIRFIIRYFSAIRKIKQTDWGNPQKSIICKTISIGAFIKVLHFLFVKIFLTEFNKEPLSIKNVTTENLIDWLTGIEKIDFSNESEFAGVASGGSLNKLKELMIQNISYLEGDSYSEFLDYYKRNYLKPFKRWIEEQVV